MSSMIDSLNLRPQEKRAIVAIAVVVFIVLNIVLVFPHFKDYGKIQRQLQAARDDIAKYNAVIAKDRDPANGWKKTLADMEKSSGGTATFKEIALAETVTAVARASGVFIASGNPVSTVRIGPGTESDKFFESQSLRILGQAADDALVKFLWDLGNDPAMIRVWELELHPLDNNRYKLNAAITLTADYLKTAATNSAMSKTNAASAKAAQPPVTVPTKARTPAPSNNVNPAPARKSPPGSNAPSRANTPSRTNAPPGFRRNFLTPPVPGAPNPRGNGGS